MKKPAVVGRAYNFLGFLRPDCCSHLYGRELALFASGHFAGCLDMQLFRGKYSLNATGCEICKCQVIS